MKNINIEQIIEGYLLSWFDEENPAEQQKCFYNTLDEVYEHLKNYFNTTIEVISGGFEGYVGMFHDSYQEDF